MQMAGSVFVGVVKEGGQQQFQVDEYYVVISHLVPVSSEDHHILMFLIHEQMSSMPVSGSDSLGVGG